MIDFMLIIYAVGVLLVAVHQIGVVLYYRGEYDITLEETSVIRALAFGPITVLATIVIGVSERLLRE